MERKALERELLIELSRICRVDIILDKIEETLTGLDMPRGHWSWEAHDFMMDENTDALTEWIRHVETVDSVPRAGDLAAE